MALKPQMVHYYLEIFNRWKGFNVSSIFDCQNPTDRTEALPLPFLKMCTSLLYIFMKSSQLIHMRVMHYVLLGWLGVALDGFFFLLMLFFRFLAVLFFNFIKKI